MRTKSESAQSQRDDALPPKRPPAPSVERRQGHAIPQSKLVEELGFVGVDPGGLDDSWRQPPGTLVTPTVAERHV